MTSEEEEITWVSMPNTVEKRTLDSSLIYTLVPSRKLRRRTKLMNATIKKLHRVKTYSRYVQVKTAVLRCMPHDTDTDDSDDYTDDDFRNIYKSDESMKQFLLKNSRNSRILTYTDSDEDDYINLSELVEPTTSDNNLGWKTVIKRKSKRLISKQQTSNQIIDKSKQTPRRSKTVAPQKDKKQKTIKKIFTPSSVKHSKEDTNEENNASSNVISAAAPETTLNIIDAVTENNTSDPEIHLEINDDTAAKEKAESDNVEQDETAESDNVEQDEKADDDNAKEEITHYDNDMEELSMKNNFRDDDEPDDTTCNNGKRKDLEQDVHLSDNISNLVRDDSLENIFIDNKNHSGESVKKNLTNIFSGCSVISHNKDSESKDNVLDESIDNNRTHFRFSEINAQCRSTPLALEKKNSEIGAHKPTAGHPKDSGIDEDSQEESLDNEESTIINAAPDNNASPPLENNNGSSDEFEEQSTILANQDAKEANQPNDSSQESHRERDTHVSRSEIGQKDQVQNEKPQPKVTCTSILNQKVTIINLMPKVEVRNTDEHLETKLVPEEPEADNLDSDKSIFSQKQESNTDKPIDNEDGELSEEYPEYAHLVYETSTSSKKRLHRLKRANLFYLSSSSEDEDVPQEKTLQQEKESNEITDSKIVTVQPNRAEPTVASMKHAKNTNEHLETEQVLDQPEADDLHNDKSISSPKQESNTDELVDIKDDELSKESSENENLMDEISTSAKKRLNQLKRLNLFEQCSSSEDEDTNQEKTLQQKKKSNEVCDSKIDTIQPNSAEPIVASTKKSENPKAPQRESSLLGLSETIHGRECIDMENKPFNTQNEDSSDKENTEKENGHEKTDFDEPNHSFHASMPNSISASPTKKNFMESMQKSPKKSEQRLSPSFLDRNVKKNNRRHIGTATHNFVVNGETQTDVHIPVETVVTHERPRKLQQYVEEENLIIDYTPAAFANKDISDEEDVYLIDMPASVLNTGLIGEKIVLKKKKSKFGNQKYKSVYKDGETLTCILGSGKIRNPFKIVEIKPKVAIVCHTKIQQEQSALEFDKSDLVLKLSDSAEEFHTPKNKTKLKRKLKSNSDTKTEATHHHESSPNVSYQKRKKRKRVLVRDNEESTN